MNDTPPWLSPAEQRSWRAFVRLHQKLSAHISREECPDDGRGAFVVLAPAGRTAIEAAAPHHVATVRRLVIDALGPRDLATLGRISNRILDQLDKAPP